MNNLEIKNDKFFENSIRFVIVIVLGLLLPFILLPLVKVGNMTGLEIFQSTEIIEEIAKALVVLFFICRFEGVKLDVYAGILFGILFGFSETMFYLSNIFTTGDFSVFWDRILYTIPMHIITTLILVFSVLYYRWFIIFGLLFSSMVHIFYNYVFVYLIK